jgi:hypothetical protein
MSIVYDYLKQIQAKKPLDKGASPAPASVSPATAAVPAAASGKKKVMSTFWFKIGVTILGIAVLGLMLYFFPPQIEKTPAKTAPVAAKPRAVKPEAVESGMVLEGIIYNPSRPFAIINGKMLEVGGRVGDYEASEIASDYVILKNLKDGTSRTIRL